MKDTNYNNLKDEIYQLIGFNIDLSSFEYDDLIATRDELVAKKENISDDIKQWFDDDLYDKLK